MLQIEGKHHWRSERTENFYGKRRRTEAARAELSGRQLLKLVRSRKVGFPNRVCTYWHVVALTHKADKGNVVSERM